jgi:hypothetical protein
MSHARSTTFCSQVLDIHESVSSQYRSLADGRLLPESQIMPSTGRRGDAYDATMESFMTTIKEELISDIPDFP